MVNRFEQLADPFLPPVPEPDPVRVTVRPDPDGIHIHLPLASLCPWPICWGLLGQALKQQRWHHPYPTTLWAEDWPLDPQLLHSLATLLEHYRLHLTTVQTRHRPTAIAAASLGYSVIQASPWLPPQPIRDPSPLYVQTTLRSGSEIRHSSTVIIWGDVNPGAEIRAEGDILVWGRLRGLAHAGCAGSPTAVIVALQLEPTQLRIADAVARSPEPHPHPVAEVAYLRDNAIYIAAVSEYLRQRS
ncbi:MAG: septum site-determining protein MinC [Thermostichales cyanobacterium SZTDM-1c_bins_54]